jgi:hypothetical protein
LIGDCPRWEPLPRGETFGPPQNQDDNEVLVSTIGSLGWEFHRILVRPLYFFKTGKYTAELSQGERSYPSSDSATKTRFMKKRFGSRQTVNTWRQ